MAVTANYETVMIISMKKGEEGIQAIVEKFKALIEKHATLKNVDEWGKRRLAYEVQHMKEAFYYFIQFDAEPAAPAEIEDNIRIMENIVRFLCVRQDEA